MSGSRASDGVLEIEYGYYPQTVAPKTLQGTLTSLYDSGSLISTYTIDSRKYNDYDNGIAPITLKEYEYNGKRYVRVKANSCFDGEEFTLSNGEKYKDGDYVFVEVEPIKWLVNEDTNEVLSEKILFAIQFHHESNYTGDFSKTDIKNFLDKCFAKEIVQNIGLNKKVTTGKERKTRLQMINPDTTKLSERRNLTYTELIHTWIENGQSVLLRGPSGIGKTERLKELYPNLIYLKLTNNMFPEKVVGSVNLQTGEAIPPDYAKEVLLAMATDEEKIKVRENIQNLYDIAEEIYERSKSSKEKIVILLDELLNVKPAVQSLVYTLVLNKIVEVGSGLKLPNNTVIVATGNQKKYSSVSNDIAEPLEKRFDHILDMEPRVFEWINDYAVPKNVHPSVVGYILSRYMMNNRSEAIKDIGYFYEEPEVGEAKLDKYGCRGRTNDPRGWVSLSNTLYAFEEDLKNGKFIGKNVEHILKMSINTKLREEWAIEFFNYYNMPTLTVDDIVNNNYTEDDLPIDINGRFACLSSLLLAEEDQVAVCRDFIKEHCDKEYLQLYDMCWIADNTERLLKINELEEMEKLSSGERMAIGV